VVRSQTRSPDRLSHHTNRVGRAAAEIASELGLEPALVELIREAAPLHDIGKLAIPDEILLKPGPLTLEERVRMQSHAEIGGDVLRGSCSPVLRLAATIAMSHHERWDGSGYPAGLSGEAIPLVGRIVAVADVFDALTQDRPYKRAWPQELALAEIKRTAGSHFDPCVVDAFLSVRTDSRTPRERCRADADEERDVLVSASRASYA